MRSMLPLSDFSTGGLYFCTIPGGGTDPECGVEVQAAAQCNSAHGDWIVIRLANAGPMDG